MNYEEKYKAALERARALNDGKDVDVEAGTTTCEYIFPELKMPEDEKIRKDLMGWIEESPDKIWRGHYKKDVLAWLEKQSKKTSMFTNIEDDVRRRNTIRVLAYARSLDTYNQYGKADIDKNIAWLEKQGIQTTDKVEPKFKVGDWIVLPLGIIAHIDSINSTDYQVTTTDGEICDFKISKQDNYRLWSITDAKNGDLIYVSTEEKGIQAIFHEYKNDTIFFHCYLCADFVQGGYMPIGSVELTYPLQKTHYNRFFEKMHEAGYEWDGEKKELKKIEVVSEESELEKQGEKFTAIDVDKMVMEYSHTKDGDFGLPVNCMTRAYRKGINDALKVKQGNTLESDKVIAWLNDQACQGWIEDVEVDKFKKDFGL